MRGTARGMYSRCSSTSPKEESRQKGFGEAFETEREREREREREGGGGEGGRESRTHYDRLTIYLSNSIAPRESRQQCCLIL